MIGPAKYVVLVEATRAYGCKPPRGVDRKANALQQRVYWALMRTCQKTAIGWVADDAALEELGKRLAPIREAADAFNREYGERGWRVRLGAYPVPLLCSREVPGFSTAIERVRSGH